MTHVLPPSNTSGTVADVAAAFGRRSSTETPVRAPLAPVRSTPFMPMGEDAEMEWDPNEILGRHAAPAPAPRAPAPPSRLTLGQLREQHRPALDDDDAGGEWNPADVRRPANAPPVVQEAQSGASIAAAALSRMFAR